MMTRMSIIQLSSDFNARRWIYAVCVELVAGNGVVLFLLLVAGEAFDLAHEIVNSVSGIVKALIVQHILQALLP